MAVNLSPLGGVGAQFFDSNGNPLSGGLIYTYAAGTSTPQATYTSSIGSIQHSNPIVLDAAGRVPTGEIWLTDGESYKFVIQTSSAVLVGTYDNIVGINSNFIAYTLQQEIQTATANQTVFTLATMQYQPGTNSLCVYVDGVNQYGPGAQYAYVETSSNVVTFVNGLHVGASVKFTTAQSVSSNYANAANVTYDPPFTDAVATNVEAKLSESVSVKDFGAVGDGVTNDTDAFAAASAYINSVGGGKLVIPQGTYIVGKQTFAGAIGQGYSYKAADIIKIENCTSPVIIEGNGAILKIDNNLKYGSFDPVTGNVYNPVLPFYNSDYAASIGAIINVQSNANVEIKNLELDGNISAASIGGDYGDSGIQLLANGIYSIYNENVSISDVYTHHHGEDGITIAWTGLSSATTQIYPHSLTNVISQYNGRQALSWVGGNSLTCTNCDFSFTGKNGVVASAPAAGVDIEPESSICINGTFIDCRFFDNTGSGCLTTNTTSTWDCSFYNCSFIGTTSYSLYGTGLRYTYYGCNLIGSSTNMLGDANNKNSAKCYGCTFSMTASNSPTGTIYSVYHNFAGGENILFDGCKFDADNSHELPWSASGNPIYSNCNFAGLKTTDSSQTRGIFIGYNTFTYLNSNDFGSSIFYGPTYVNGAVKTVTVPTLLSLTFLANNGFTSNYPRIQYYYSPTAWTATVGTANQGDMVLVPLPSAGGNIGWVCTTGGNSSTSVWKTFGAISA